MSTSRIRLLIHGWELPSFPTDSLRNETRRALRHVLERGIPGLAKATIDFDNLRPQRPRDPEELATWHTPIREAIDMEYTGSEAEAQAIRYRVSQLVMFVLRKYVAADAHNRARKRAIRRYLSGEDATLISPPDVG